VALEGDAENCSIASQAAMRISSSSLP